MGTSLYVREIWKDTGKTATEVDLLSESPSLKGYLPPAPDKPEQGPGAISPCSLDHQGGASLLTVSHKRSLPLRQGCGRLDEVLFPQILYYDHL